MFSGRWQARASSCAAWARSCTDASIPPTRQGFELSKSLTTSTRKWRAQSSARASYYRGGTSRAVIFQPKDLPATASERRSAFLQIMGAPDRHGRQLNGMGAGVSSLSKICLVEPSNREGIDIEYTFVGIGIENDEVDYAGNCGNMSASVGPYAFNERLLNGLVHDYEAEGDITVRIWQTNTSKLIRSTFHVANGEAQVDDETGIDGVSGLGTGIFLDFVKPSGSKTGSLLPTGSVMNTFEGIKASCVDAANPCVFIRAADLSIEPTILPAKLSAQLEIMAKLEAIRSAAAVVMGVCKTRAEVPRVIPKIAIVSPAQPQITLSGEQVQANQLDLVVRFLSDGQPHRAIPLTGALCTAAAARLQGSIVQQCLAEKMVDGELITIGHPSGRVQVDAKMDANNDVESCTVVRTARRIMEGKVFWNMTV